MSNKAVGCFNLLAMVICVAGILSVASVTAKAGTIVNISATTYGCDYTPCHSWQTATPGTTVTPISFANGGTLDQLTLGPGTYTISNAVGMTGADYSGWRYDSGNDWAWGFLMVNDANDTILLDDYVNSSQSSQSAIANLTNTTTWDGTNQLSATSTAGFTDSFTLSQTTTLDFMVNDYYLPDNAGGVSLNIAPAQSSVPEPGTFVLLASGLAVVWQRKRFF